jgi:anti-sigma B factor antagonist
MIHINTSVENDVITLILNGDVDASSSINLDNAINDVKNEGHKKILINAQELHYISSAGLGVFMSYIKDFEKEDIKLALYGLNEKVLNVFKMLGLDQLLTIELNADDALKSVNA